MTSSHRVKTQLAGKASFLAQKALAAPHAGWQALLGLAEMCRAAGDLAMTRALVERAAAMTDDRRVEVLRSIFSGDAIRSAQPSEGRPVPFVRVLDVLPAAQREWLDAAVRKLVANFEPAEVVGQNLVGETDPTKRQAWIGPVEGLAADFLPHIKSALAKHRVLQRLGFGHEDRKPSFELQLTCSTDGCFFKPHHDNSVLLLRQISFVYYFVLAPKRFSGGDLLLYDEAAADGSHHYTRIAPLENSLVFFPSSALHEVEMVHVSDGGIEAGRFTLNGWLRF